MEAQAKQFDLIVIGAGSGGLGMGRRAAQYGQKVAMVENRDIGGTCVNVGCVPKKVMWNLANFLEETEVMKCYGVSGTENLKLDFATFKEKRDAYVKRLNGIYHTNVGKSGISYFEGTASFADAKTVKTSLGETLTANHILIASGSYPRTPPFEGGELCMTSDDIFNLTELPKSMIVLGGGYIAVEMAQIMQGFGVKVTLIARNQMLVSCDSEILDVLKNHMTHTGLDVRLKSPFNKVTKLENGNVAVHLEDGTTVEAEKILSALGRPPLVDQLNLPAAGVEVEKGGIKVDEFQNTNVPGIYALGDVTGNPWSLTPVAIRAGRMLSERLFNNKPGLKMVYENIPTVVFSHPTIAYVGLHEAAARAKFGDDNVKVYKSTFKNMFYALADADLKQDTRMKIICHKTGDGPSNEKVVGLHMIGKAVDEMLQTASVAINMGATKQDFDNSVAIHPTASEELVTMDGNYIM